jgi:hypothetical protein
MTNTEKFKKGALVWVESMGCVARCSCGWTLLTPATLSKVQIELHQPVDNFASLADTYDGRVICKFIEPVDDGDERRWIVAEADIRPVSIN